METVMQKLKRISNNLHEQYYEDITLKWLIDNIDDFIKEEKEQLEEARLKGYGEGYNEGIYDAENK